ncbi:MAG: hypothetical protein AB7S26_29365 [Sandaracinaceae bacterium]
MADLRPASVRASRCAVALSALALCGLFSRPAHAAAQYAEPVGEMSDSILSAHLHHQRGEVTRCAASEDSRAYLVEIQARVSRGARPSSMHNARISVSVRSRPRDHALESCVRRTVNDVLRNAAYAVEDPSRAHVTFRIDERPEPPGDDERPSPPYSRSEVEQALRARDGAFARCVDLGGIADTATLSVAVDPSGRLVLVNAQLPSSAPSRATSCLASTVGSIRVRGAPPRRVQLTHSFTLR